MIILLTLLHSSLSLAFGYLLFRYVPRLTNKRKQEKFYNMIIVSWQHDDIIMLGDDYVLREVKVYTDIYRSFDDRLRERIEIINSDKYIYGGCSKENGKYFIKLIHPKNKEDFKFVNLSDINLNTIKNVSYLERITL